MAQWVAIGMVFLTWVVTTAVLWGKTSERMDAMKAEIEVLQNESQTPGEREALARVVHTELEGHANEDLLRFKAIDDRMLSMAGDMGRKLDMILTAVTHKDR